MGKLLQLPPSEELAWRRQMGGLRKEIAAKGASPAATEKVMAEFRGYHRELAPDSIITFNLWCEEGFSDVQHQALTEAVYRLREDFDEYCDTRIGIAKDIILDLLVEKYR